MDKIKIGHTVYDLKITDTLYDGRLGEVNFERGYIAIRDSLQDNPTEFVATLIHEITHALAWHMSASGEPTPEEKWCDITGNGLTMVFLDNPELLDYIKQTLSPSPCVVSGDFLCR